MADSACWRPFVAGAIALGALLSAAACSDREPFSPQPEEPEAAQPRMTRLDCTADLRGGSLVCEAPGTGSGGARRAIVGLPNAALTGSNVTKSPDGLTMTVDVTVRNQMDQAMGTQNGILVAAEGVRTFFHAGPSVVEGSGTVTVGGDAAVGEFTGTNQPYYQYNQIIAPGATSAAKTWTFNLSGAVDRFVFSIYVAAPLAPRLVISEIMANPSAVDDSVGEYIEIANTGRDPVNLQGWRIASRSGSSTEQVAINSAVVVPAGGQIVIAARSNPLRNGGVTAAYEWGGTAIQLSNSTSGTAPDFVALRRPAAVGTAAALDSVVWAPTGTTTAPPTGRTRELLDLSSDNVHMSSAAWNTGYTKYGDGDGTGEFDRGTPGQPNAQVVAVGPVATVRISPGFAVVDTLKQFRRFSAFPEDTLGQASPTTITWSSSNPSVATIDQTGLVTQVDTGRTVIVATASNGMADSTLYGVFAYSAGALYRNHVEFGLPTPGGGNNDILILSDRRTQYAVSYNASRGGPNWVSWNLNRTHFGRVARAPTFYTDPLLPAYGVYQVTTNDYTNSGYTRGHMTQSEQRTQTRADNDTTFLMTNILPQLEDLNTGPWQDLEDHTNDLARFGGRELYNIAGGLYPATPQSLKNEGKVAIPTSTWKIVVILPYGRGLADVSSAADLQVIAVNMPNATGIGSNPWSMYATTVDALEAATGYDFLSALPDAIEAEVEAR